MKLHELVKPKKLINPKKFKMIITKTQFKVLAKNVLNEQEKKTIKNTHLIKTKSNAKK
jgi:hypothetical protein